MFRSAAVALLAASAVTAQDSSNGNRMVRQATDVTNIDAHVAGISYNATVAATERMYNAMTQMNRDNQAAQAAVANQINSAVANLNAQMATQSAAMSAAMSSNTANLNSAMDAQASSVASQLASVPVTLSTNEAAMISRSAVAATATMTQLRSINASLVLAMNNKASEEKHFWLGGCANSNHGCWQDFCLNQVEIDKARPYFHKRTNTRMQALLTGMFRMQAYFMGTRNWMHISVFINGRRMRYTHMHVRYGWWKSHYSDHTFFIAAGQDFWFQGCGHYHNANSDFRHQRQEFMWYGKRPN
jgi:hypothetical protein